MSFCGGAFGMASAQLILIRHEVDPCTCDRSVQESGSMFLIQIVLSNNGALNCSTGSNVVVLLNCGSQVSTRVSYAQLTSLSFSLSLSVSLSPPPPPLPLFVFLDLLGRASSEPHSYVLTWLSVTIYIYIYIDRPTSVFDPAPGVKVGCCGPNLRVVTLCENDLLYWYMHVPSHSSSNSSQIELVRV